MDERELRRGFRNGWILTLLLLLLVALWTAFTMWANWDEVEPRWAQGNQAFVPGESRHAMGYDVPQVPRQGK
jgi:hypothetical protein